MKLLVGLLIVGAVTAGAAGSALAAGKPAAKTPPRLAAPPAAGVTYEATGKVLLFKGKPCTSQIMFEFTAAHSRAPVCLAAHVKDSNVLTEAAKRRRTVQISGVWQRGREKGCRFVNVTKVTVQKGFFSW